MPVPTRFVGITVMPEFIQAEGIDRVIANLKDKAGATAVATSPNVVEEADAKTGSREPPIGRPWSPRWKRLRQSLRARQLPSPPSPSHLHRIPNPPPR